MNEHPSLFAQRRSTKHTGKQSTFTLEELGLMYSYINRYSITTEDEANTIVRQFGHTSGKKLLEYFKRYCKGSNERIGDRGSSKANQNQRERFENILSYLETNSLEAYERAKIEYITFLSKI